MPADWGALDDPSIVASDIEALSITDARLIAGLPLGCRMECTTPSGRRVSIGMLNRATFNKDEWLTMVSLKEKRAERPDRVDWWLEQKAATRGEWKVWMDRQLELDGERAYTEFPVTVGEVLGAWGWQLQLVATEL